MTTQERPKIHWISPLPPAATDIAHYSARSLEALVERADVVLWTDSVDWDRSLEDICPVRRLNPHQAIARDFASLDGGKMSGDEAVFVHIGNSWVFHSKFLQLCHRIPSVVVLHDIAIQELCRDAIFNGLLSEQTYKQEMYRWYGAEGATLAEQFLQGKVAPYDISTLAPGFEIALGRAVSVVTHTPFAFETVKARAYLPCYQLNLPFKPGQSAEFSRPQSGPLRFAQFGYIGPNRRLEQVLETLSKLPDTIDFVFDVVGNVWDPEYVSKRIDELNLTGRVRLHGFVEEAYLDELLATAHLVFNLRYPTMGEASGSQLRIWNAGAASVVTGQGWYSTIPSDTAFQISIENEQQELLTLIEKIAADRSIGETVGKMGRQHLIDWHGPDTYAEEIVAVAKRFKSDARHGQIAEVSRRVVSSMSASRDQVTTAMLDGLK